MKYALFMGCTVPVRAPNYEMSARKVADKVGVEFADILEFTCCGFPIKPVSIKATMLMAAYNLALAEEQGLPICALCSACTSVLTETAHRLNQDEQQRAEINEYLQSLGKRYEGTTKVKHFARILYEDIGIEKIRDLIKVDLSGHSFAAHYGCHYLRPSEIYEDFDSVEHPVSIDALIEATGARAADYEEKNLCCGGGILAIDEDVALKMASQKLERLKDFDALTLVCPFCSVMYEANQRSVNKRFGSDIHIPVLFLPQLLGLAMGLSESELGFKYNKVKPKESFAGAKRGSYE
jgi:heterodisulfide reductase subunit B